jgi:hypothetical protein
MAIWLPTGLGSLSSMSSQYLTWQRFHFQLYALGWPAASHSPQLESSFHRFESALSKILKRLSTQTPNDTHATAYDTQRPAIRATRECASVLTRASQPTGSLEPEAVFV